MILDDLQEIIDNAKCPNMYLENLNIGACNLLVDDSKKIFNWSPEHNCYAFSHIKMYQDNACIYIHTHGISVQIDDTKVNIHNSQIIVFDYWHFDDTVEYKRSDTRGARVVTGLLLGGPILGTAVGLATSFGKGKKHIKCDNVVIAFWDIKTKSLQIINLQEPKKSEQGSVQKMIDYWKKQKHINEETGREPVGENKAGVCDTSGCMFLLLLGLSPLLATIYTIIETLIC
ncbi:MAG: hypothetical protein J6A02_03470 [Prevotella sp.]|nr:hypothetical protein [Prevotella sp.]